MAELPKNIRRPGGDLVSARQPFGRRVLLPTEADLCNLLGITEEEYWQFVEEGYYVEVEVWLMNTDFSRNSMLTKEYWLASGMRYDPESIELLLSSAIDAVGANVPQKSLSTEQCKQLPLTGTIQNR